MTGYGLRLLCGHIRITAGGLHIPHYVNHCGSTLAPAAATRARLPRRIAPSALTRHLRGVRRRTFLKLSASTLVAAPLLDGCEAPPPQAQPRPPGPPSLDPQAFDQGRLVPFAPARVPLDENVFALSVQSGSMHSDESGASLLLWTHVERSALTTSDRVGVRVWRDTDREDAVVLVKDERVAPDAFGFVKVRMEGLAPSTWYRYAFFLLDGGTGREETLSVPRARSEVGRVRTAWATDWLWPVTLGATSCTNETYAPYNALAVLATQELDGFLHVGDMVYADGSRTREDYRAWWRRSLKDPGYRALLPRQGSYVVWDDHEIENNLDPEEVDPAQMSAAKEEFYANLPVAPGPTGALWQSYRWGRTLEIFALDCRTERLPSTRQGPAPTYLSAAQMSWLKDALRNSNAHFKVILNSVPITRMTDLWAMAGDRWQGYDAQRTELLSFLESEAIEGVWFISGDFHMGFVSRVEPTGYARNLFEAAVGPGGNLGNPLGYLASREEYREDVFPSEQFFYGEGKIAATTLAFDPLRDLVRVRYLDAEGTVLFDQEIAKDR